MISCSLDPRSTSTPFNNLLKKLNKSLEKVDIMKKRILTILVFFACLTFISGISLVTTSYAKTAKEINAEVNSPLKLFPQHVKGGKKFLNAAKGVLVIPNIVKAGLGVGGEYGEGALRIGGNTVEYYSLAAGSVGFQIGAP